MSQMNVYTRQMVADETGIEEWVPYSQVQEMQGRIVQLTRQVEKLNQELGR